MSLSVSFMSILNIFRVLLLLRHGSRRILMTYFLSMGFTLLMFIVHLMVAAFDCTAKMILL